MCLVNSSINLCFYSDLYTRAEQGKQEWTYDPDKQKMKPVVQHFTNMQCQRFSCFSLCTRQVWALARTDMQKTLTSCFRFVTKEAWEPQKWWQPSLLSTGLRSGGLLVQDPVWAKSWGKGKAARTPWQRYWTYNELTTHPGVDRAFTHMQPSCQIALKIQHHIVAILLKLNLSPRKTDTCSWGSHYTSQTESSNQ